MGYECSLGKRVLSPPITPHSENSLDRNCRIEKTSGKPPMCRSATTNMTGKPITVRSLSSGKNLALPVPSAGGGRAHRIRHAPWVPHRCRAGEIARPQAGIRNPAPLHPAGEPMIRAFSFSNVATINTCASRPQSQLRIEGSKSPPALARPFRLASAGPARYLGACRRTPCL